MQLTIPLIKHILLIIDRSKLDLMYQEVCYSCISSGFIKEMKDNPRNNRKKTDSLSLDTSLLDVAIED